MLAPRGTENLQTPRWREIDSTFTTALPPANIVSRGDMASQRDIEILYRKRIQVVLGNPHLQRVTTSS
jgi:hypothetical protein